MNTTERDPLAYFDELRANFARAAQHSALCDQHYLIGGQLIRLRFAGDALLPPITRALAHLRCDCGAPPALTIHLWDSDSTHTRMTPPAWTHDDFREHGILRGFFDGRIYTPDEGVRHAMELAAGATRPIVIADTQDNPGAGGDSDTTGMLRALVRNNAARAATGVICDPQSANAAHEAGVGATVTLALGGRTDMPAIDRRGEPLAVTGRVRTLSDGEWIVRGPMYTGVKVSMGPSAVLDTGRIQIVIVSRHHEPWDQGVFTSLGIEPRTKRYLLLKSRIHYRAGFAPLARATITLDGEGVTTSDNDRLQFQQVRRPIFPLDRLNAP